MYLGIGLSICNVLAGGGGTPAPGPSNTVAPVASGAPEIGQTLSSTNGTWSGTGTIAYAYQWTRNGADIASATSSTYTLVGADDDASIRCRVTATDDDGSKGATSNALTARYAAGTAPTIAAQSWTVDDDAVSLDASASGANLTFTYSATGLPGNAAINSGSGSITVSGNGGAFAQGDVGSGSISITATDQYGRTLDYTAGYTIALRSQATAADGLGPYAFTVGEAISATNLAADFTAGGNTLAYAITGTALPAALSVSGAGSMTGTVSAEATSASYTVRATDEYGRTTDSTFTLSATASDVTAPTVSSAASNVAGDTITLTLTEAVTGTEATGDWDVNDVTGGSATVDSVDISGDTITLGLTGNLVNGDDSPTVDYTAGDIEDASENALATFTNQAVTNNVPQFAYTVVDNTLVIENNDGRDIPIDAEDDRFDGTHQVDPEDSDVGPVILVAPGLQSDGTPAPNEVLDVLLPFIAYDPDLGTIDIGDLTYTTNAENDVDLTDPYNPTLTVHPTLDDGKDLSVTVHVPMAGYTTATSQSNTVSIPGGVTPSLSFEFVGTEAKGTFVTTDPEFDPLDLTNGEAGDYIVSAIGNGVDAEPVTYTIQGDSMLPPIETNYTSTPGTKSAAFIGQLSGAGQAAAVVDVETANTYNSYMFAAALVKSVGTVTVDQNSLVGIGSALNLDTIPTPVSVSVTPDTGTNLVIAMVVGRSTLINGNHSWSGTGLTQVSGANQTGGANTGVDMAIATNVTGDGSTPYTVEFYPPSTANGGDSNDEIMLYVVCMSVS